MHAAFLNEKNEVSFLALRIDVLIMTVGDRAPAGSNLHEQAVSINPIGAKY